MLSLVEFQMINKMKSNFCRLEYLPNMAAAQLIASCRADGIKTRLIKGQTRYLKDVFINEQKELFDLLNMISNLDLSKAMRGGFNNLPIIHDLFIKDENEFSTKLKNSYKVATGQSKEDYLDKHKILDLLRIKNGIFELYDYCYHKKGEKNLSVINNLFESIKKTKPEILAFSFTSNYDYAHVEYVSDYIIDVINKAKKELEIPIIASGQMMPTMDHLEDYIFNHLDVDYFIFDDGVSMLPSAVKKIEEGNSLEKIQNIGYKKNGKAIRNFQEYSFNFDSLPSPDFSDFDLDNYFFPERLLPLHVATTCSWGKCVFCEDIAPRLRQSQMGEDKFLEIIKEYREKFKTHFVEIQSISPSADKVQKYMAALIKNDINDVFFAMLSRLESIFCSREVAKTLHDGGMRYIMWGLESGNQKTLDRMNKGTKLEIIEKILKNFNAAGIKNMCYVIIGFPGETKKEFKKTVDFLQKNHKLIDGTIIIPFNLFKNSPIARQRERFFIKSILPNENNPATYRYNVAKGISQEERRIILRDLRAKVDAGQIKISNNNMDPIDQSYIDKIGGFDALHHILFYLACKN